MTDLFNAIGNQTPMPTGGDAIYRLLASAWFYGGWKAETVNERMQQNEMEGAGWWPIRNEAELFTKLDAASVMPSASSMYASLCSIAANTCCETCQEAARVARRGLSPAALASAQLKGGA